MVALAVGQRGGQPAEHGGQRHPVPHMGLRVEEDLGPADPGRDGPGQVRAGQVVEVLLSLKDPQVRVVQVQEGLQAVELVPGSQFGHVRGGQRDVVARRQADQQLWLERAFDVQMQLSDGKHA